VSESFCKTDGRPTRRDVAKLAMVSGTTVSRVLGGRPDESVSAKARQKVLDAARQLGYTPNSAAKALRSGQSGLVGLWMCLEYSRFRSEVLAEMRKIFTETEYALVVNDVDHDYAWHRSLDRALRVPAEGIIAFEPMVPDEAYTGLDVNLPFVSMGAFCVESRSYVRVDLRPGAEEATEHLLQIGRKKIAYVKPRGPAYVTDGERYQGYLSKMTAAGLSPCSIEVGEDPESRVADLRKMLSSPDRPEAVFCYFDDIAIDAVEVLLSLGLRPGRDVAVVGFNGEEGTERGPCPVSSVRQPIEEMCRIAYTFLTNQIEDPTLEPELAVLKPKLVVRQSSLPG
jgi:LacI family transcriptional regulator